MAKEKIEKKEKKKQEKIFDNNYCPDDVKELYLICHVALKFRERLYGGLPKMEEMIEGYVEKGLGATSDLSEKLKKEIDILKENGEKGEELKEAIASKIEQSWTGFKKNGKGCYLSDYQFRAMLREAAQRLDMFVKTRGTRQVFQHDIVIKPNQVVLKPEPDGYEEFCGHIIDQSGPRSILKRCDYVDQAEVSFDIWILKHSDMKLTPVMLKKCFMLGQELGMGSNRSFMKGKFDLVSFTWDGMND
jgi:hypothetical protein